VPTLAPTAIPKPTVVVSVNLSPVRAKRGTAMRLTVQGTPDDRVSVVLQYHHGKPVTYHGKVDSSGTYTKTWKVPKLAPLGKAEVKVTVTGSQSAVPTTVDFVVLK
jgi:hypothetical protein